MPLPVAHGFMGASVVASSSRNPDWKALLMGAFIGICPDFDLFFRWVLGFGVGWHGSFSHSITFAVAAGFLAAAVMGRFHLREIVVFGSATFLHALLDAATSKTWGGVMLLWPFSTHDFKLGLIEYFEFFPGSNLQPLADEIKRAFRISFYELLIFGPIFLTVFFIRRYADKRAEPEQT